ncbi:tetratricopeptide repeat protein 21A isoform X2 [Hemicordylus capensis]|uniref:tetratricopeptide repeat protein 21A isoform X2 n=1 Tax=Hemicordylus capensis TaxID=884348 RepID=UPI0023023F11|nr:tetratricopeptide repeat protein 21A isoform X2 [Hemicordylus capensis]
MADADPQALARILFYAQEKYFNHVIQLANIELAKHAYDPVLLFFKAFGTLLLGRVQEGISLLENVRKRHVDVSLCCLLGLIYAHKKCENVDAAAVLDLENKLKETRRTAGSNALYYAGMFLWLMNKNDKAKEYVDKMLKVSNGAREGLVLKGWVYVTCDKQHAVKKSIKYLDEGIQDNTDIFGMMGKTKYFMVQQNYSGALEIISQLVVTFPFFTPALVTKMKLHLALQDWEQSVEESKRILSREANDIDALQHIVVHQLAMTGNINMALHHLREFIAALELKEPQRPELHLQKIIVISRLSGKNHEVLQEVCEFIKNSCGKLTSTDARFANELGYQLILQGNWKEASVWYRKAVELDENTVDSLTGIIWCLVLGGKLEEAEQQLEFLKEVQQSIGKSSVLAYLQAMIASRTKKNEKSASALLNEAAELHFSALHGLPLSIEYYEKLNPMFLIEIVKEYLVFCPKQPRLPGQVLSSLLKQATIILNPIVKAAPGMIEPLFLMAQVKYLSGELETAQGTLQRCLELDPTSTDASLLMAEIHLSQGNIKECSLSLEIGVSYNFQLRDYPMYHFIKARALNKSGEYPEAIKILKMLISLPQMKEAKKSQGPRITTSEQVSIYLELAKGLRLNGELHEATKIMQDAINEFSGTSEEIRITVANVDLALSKGDVDLALTMLRNITPNQPYYTEVKEKMAQIYLQIRKDKRLYIGCYCELCQNLPSPHTSLLLGDAYMNIQEPEKALEVYEAAQKKNPLDATVARKIGQAYVNTHQYNKAINYYEVALKMSEQDFLCHDLADLLLKLKKFGKAEKVLNQALDHDPVDDLPSMMKDVKNLMLLAKVYEATKREVVLETLNKANGIQQRILKRVRVEQPELIPPQKQVALIIYVQFAEFCREEKNYADALRYYTEALSCVPTDSKIILELAHLHLMQGDTDQCEHYCALMLQDDNSSETGTMMRANLMFRKEEYKEAIRLYQTVLEKRPDNFSVIESLIDLLRRSGKLDEVTPFFELAKKKSTRIPLEPGYNYCKGLYCWHMGQPNQALKFFNKARKDSDWGQKALSYMIQICLNPDKEIIGGEAFDNQTGDASILKEKRESEQHGIRTAEKLLKEFYPHSQESQNQVEMLQSYCLMATKERYNVEKALHAFTEMAQNEKENVPAILAMAQAFMILKSTSKARTQLKRLNKVNWSLTDAEELEKGWILLSDIYCTTGKYDLATALVKRCLQYNKSCSKAYECLGFIAEREKAYKDAAANYELAWKYSNHTNPAIGFKLAFNYLKDKRYVEAIDVCHDVLKACPDYPKIREEILEKAQTAIRP